MNFFEDAKARYDVLYERVTARSKALRDFPRNGNGLTPDAVKASDEYRAALNGYNFSRRILNEYDRWFHTAFKAEIKAERRARRAARMAA